MIFKPSTHGTMITQHIIKNPVAAVFAGMGLGKTCATLDALSFLFSDTAMQGVLIVAPLRVAVLTWPNEIEKWEKFGWMRVANLRTKEGIKAWHEKSAEIYLINYESLPTFAKNHIKGKKKSEMPVDTIVFDELTKAKNPGSKRINYFRKYMDYFERRIGLTGTPVPNSQLDLFGQIRLLDDGERFGKFFGHYRREYFTAENTFSNYPKYILREESKELIESKISDMTITLTSEDWLDIPETITEDIEVALPPEAKKVYKELEKELLVELANDFEMIAVNAAVLTKKLLQVTSGAVYVQQGDDKTTRKVEFVHDAKIKALRKLYQDQGRQPIIVACQFRHEIARIKEAFPDAREFTQELLGDWNAGKIPMLLSHPASIGHGLNLQDGGSRVVWFSLDHSRELYDQMNARVARMGQTDVTRIFRLLIAGTVDDAVADAIRGKGENQSAFLQTLKNIQKLAA